MRGVWLEDLTWPEAKACFDRDDVVVIPVGAAARAHGAHLPLGTDALMARALAQRLIERLPVVVAPVVGFGFHPAFASFAGSQHLERETFRQMMSELVVGFRTQGASRIAVLDVAASTEKPLDELDNVLALHTRLMGRAADHLIERLDGGPAGERETSIVLALAARSVRMDRLAPPADVATGGATGDPTRATAFKGERLLAAQVDDMVMALVAKWPSLAE